MRVSWLTRVARRDSAINRQTQKGLCPANLRTSTDVAIARARATVNYQRKTTVLWIVTSIYPLLRDAIRNNKTGLARCESLHGSTDTMYTRVYTTSTLKTSRMQKYRRAIAASVAAQNRAFSSVRQDIFPMKHTKCYFSSFSHSLSSSPLLFPFRLSFSLSSICLFVYLSFLSGDRLAIAETDRRSESRPEFRRNSRLADRRAY